MADAVAVLPPGWRALDADSNILPGAKLKFYDAGTSTPRTVYSDQGLTAALGVEVTCDAGGYPVSGGSTKTPIYIGTASYKLRLETAAGVLVWEHDQLKGAVAVPAAATQALPVTPVVNKATAYTVQTADRGKLIMADPTGGSFAITLLSAITAGDGFRVGVRHAGDATINVVVVRSTSGQYIRKSGHETATSFALVAEGQTVWFVSDGTQWIAELDQPYMPDRLVVFAVKTRTNIPPASPVGGDRYLINGTPIGVWATLGFAQNQIAEADGNGSWLTYNPGDGWLAYVLDADTMMQYRTSTWVEWNNIVAPGASNMQVLRAEHRETNGTSGGTSTANAWTKRTINTAVENSISGASVNVGTSEITLPTGLYLITAEQTLYNESSGGGLGTVTEAQQRLTAGTAVISTTTFGLPTRSGSQATGAGVTLVTTDTHVLRDIFVVNVTTAGTLTLEYYVSAAQATNGLGRPSAEPSGAQEVYARVSVVNMRNLQGPAGSTGPQGPAGPQGWAPVYAVVSDGARRVMQHVSWTGGAGTPPAVTGDYVSSSGLTPTIASATDIRGPAGATGAGTGDMLAANNLGDVASVPAALNNLGLLNTVGVTSTYVVPTTGAAPQIHITGSNSGTITFNAASGYPANYQCSIHNDTTRRWTIACNGRSNFFLWPGQSCRVTRVGSVWWPDKPDIWVLQSAGVLIYVNHTTGSSANDGLTAGAPLPTIQAAIDLIEKYIDTFQFGIGIKVTGSFTEGGAVTTKRLRGFHVIYLEGDLTTPANCTWTVPAGQVGLTARDWSGIIVAGFKMQSAGSGSTGLSASQFGVIDVDRMDWGTFTGGIHMEATSQGALGYVTPTTETISGDCAVHWNVGPDSKIICTGATIDIPNARSITVFLQNNGGTFIGAGNTFTGAGAGTGTTGVRHTVGVNGKYFRGFDDAVTVTSASPAVVTLTGHGLVVNSEVNFYASGSMPTGITTGVTYYVIAAGLTANTFQISATAGGAAINTSSTGSGVRMQGDRLPGTTAGVRTTGGQVAW